MQTLITIYEWAFSSEKSDPKHTSLPHPLFSAILGTAIFCFGIYKISNFFETQDSKLKGQTPKWAKNYLGPFIVTYLAALILSRYFEKGAWTLYDVLWGCNSSLIFLVFAIYGDKPFMVSTIIIVIALDQVMWYVDLIGYLVTKKFLIGVVKYLFWKETPWSNIITSTHHLWFIPVGVALVYKSQKPVSWESFKASCFVSLMWCAISRVLTPFTIVLSDGVKYMNINSCYEPWKDVKFGWFRSGDGLNVFGFFLFEAVVWNSINFFLYVFIKIGFELAKSKKKLI